MKRFNSSLWAIGCIALLPLSCASNRDLSSIAASSSERSDLRQPSASQIATKPVVPPTSSKSSVNYAPTAAAFLNPERGFHNDIELMSGRDFSDVRGKGYSIARASIRLDEYRNTPLPASFLARLNQQFQLVRSAGIKVIPRFSYNFPTGNDDVSRSPDASLALTIEHINQLKPVLEQNADAIATIQAGFIGAWGEWHSSASGLDRPESKAKILAALLTAMPSSRMVQIRYPNDIRTIYPQSLTLANAFNGNRQSRVGFHNDCFLSNRFDAGTYSPNPAELKNYISKISPFIAIGGETCQVTPTEHRSDCPTAEAELAKFHWSYINSYFYEPDIERWRKEGCHARIARSLGYRFQLLQSNFPTKAQRGRTLTGNFTIKNVGYASPYNPRGLELIARHRETGIVYRLPLLKPTSKTHDPRFWLPQAGKIFVDVRAKMPQNAPSGVYELLLNLPDPMPKLSRRPEYSIRLANEQTWEAKTGFNSLRRTVQLTK
jgi:Domain of unknown function (DUF4832)/Domain of unknown function (DUF4874)